MHEKALRVLPVCQIDKNRSQIVAQEHQSRTPAFAPSKTAILRALRCVNLGGLPNVTSPCQSRLQSEGSDGRHLHAGRFLWASIILVGPVGEAWLVMAVLHYLVFISNSHLSNRLFLWCNSTWLSAYFQWNELPPLACQKAFASSARLVAINLICLPLSCFNSDSV